MAAQFVAEVAERMIPEREANERLFRLFLAVLRSLKHSGEVTGRCSTSTTGCFAWRGFLPDFERCQNASRTLGDKAALRESGTGSGLRNVPDRRRRPKNILPSDCRRARRLPAAARAVDREEKAPPGCREARRFLEELIEPHAERKLVTRAMMEEAV